MGTRLVFAEPATGLYRKNPKYSDTGKIAVIILKFEQCSSSTKEAEGIANNIDLIRLIRLLL